MQFSFTNVNIINLWNKIKSIEFRKFLIAGVLNSLLTYTLYILLAIYLRYEIAYGLSYAAGIVISYLLNARYVFNEKYTLKTFFRYPLVYVFQYLLCFVMLYVLVEVMSFDKYLAPLIVIALSIPFTFILSRFMLRTS